MRVSAYITKDSYDGKRKNLIGKLDTTFIRSMPDETAGMSTGTWNECEVDRIICFIIKILRNKVVVFCFNCYHKNGHGNSYVLG